MIRPALPRLLLLFFIAGCASSPPDVRDDTVVPVPAPPHAFRGVWIATVANIDWPSRPGLPVATQQAELSALLDRARALHLNAVILQVRPAGDALYASELEPWSPYLTGQMGRAPEPFYDPLAFAVEEAHRRRLELHAWFNPFRVRHSTYTGAIAATHISRTRPELVRSYGDLLWLDPGEPEARAHSLRVILDVVRRYDIDGIHLDDYFYPYPIQNAAGRDVPFPDSASWARAVAGGTTLGRDDWRRQNVDLFVEQLYREIKQAKPHVRFGISPFGIWRPGHPPGIEGFDAYARLYADARKWLQEGWVDYFSPQLYWPIAQRAQSFPVLLDWWAAQNTSGRHLWPGLFTSRVVEPGARRWAPEEIAAQIRLVQQEPQSTGHVHFSMKALVQQPALAALLVDSVYAGPALVPPSPWLDDTPPGAPDLRVVRSGEQVHLALTPPSGEPVWLWVVRYRHGGTWTLDVVPGRHLELPLDPAWLPETIAVSAVDRLSNEGPVATLDLTPPS